MRKIRIFMLATASMALAAQSTTAQDGDKRFEGLYGGFEAGYDRTEFLGLNDNAFYYGLNLGYKYQTDSDWVWGLEGSFGDTSFDEGVELPPLIAFDVFDDPEITSNFQWSAALSAGKAFGDNLVSLRFGIAGTELRSSDTGEPDANGALISTGPVSFHSTGYLAGVQYERAISRRISLKLGFDYIDYGNGFDQFQPKAGINIKF